MSNQEFKFALNHMACPTLSPLEMLDMAAELGIHAVELRNDVRENSISDIDQAHAIAKLAIAKGITVLSINALYPFNIWEDERAEQASHLADLASASGAQMLVCCPLVSADYDANDAERGEQLRVALRELRPILESKGLIGCIEPLGFPISTLRFKADAITAIHDIGGEGTFRLVHDTFHHRGAAETEMYASMTGLVHISGVEDPGVSTKCWMRIVSLSAQPIVWTALARSGNYWIRAIRNIFRLNRLLTISGTRATRLPR